MDPFTHHLSFNPQSMNTNLSDTGSFNVTRNFQVLMKEGKSPERLAELEKLFEIE